MRYYLPVFLVAIMTLLTPGYAATPIPGPNVEVYTIPGCIGCEMAKSLLEERGIRYKEISLQGRRDLYAEMKRRAGADPEESLTVPRIFINGKYIGGYSDLRDFNFEGSRPGDSAAGG